MTMLRASLILFFLSVASVAAGQCLSGNCVNGTGRYDFGWCVYEGSFKDSKAEGQGIMKYSDYTYTGSFRNGVEDGSGVVKYIDGKEEKVVYHNGRKAEAAPRIAEDYKPIIAKDPNCISGDCVNGYGTYRYPSGNTYTGDFKDRRREGEGRVVFTNGEQFAGTWHNNEKVKGTYTFANGARYTGTYDANGMERDGEIRAGDVEIPYINGIAIVPPAKPKVVYTKSSRPGGPQQQESTYKPLCPTCHGLGQTHETFSGGAIAVDKYGNRSTTFGQYTKCSRCRGSGHVD